MTATSAMPTAKERQKKTRTKRVSLRPALAVSTLLPNQIELFFGREHMVCPDCRTWCPITGVQGSPKLVPHHTEPKGTPEPRRCIGSNRRVLLDLTVDEWHQRRADAIADTASRRATRVLPKPKTTATPAATQIKPVPLSAEAVRRIFRLHQAQCSACTGEATNRNGELLPCPDGERLALTFLRLVRQEPKRAKVREFFARERARFDRQHVVQTLEQRAAEWAKHAGTAKKGELAKRSGTAVEEINNQCKLAPKGAVS
ncbi:hypothetical protein [Streptomyces sp. 8N706]|uniref:hypothetical protein n=1 Tax=Streptomyces sp. 8N706 TaxID=3457416 RepID=UPI003FD21E7E